jgi:probable rRNA maturation factor
MSGQSGWSSKVNQTRPTRNEVPQRPSGSPAQVDLEVAIVAECEAWESIDGVEAVIAKAARTAFRAATFQEPKPSGLLQATVTVALLSDADIRSLNKQFRGKDTATNVLSFPSAAFDVFKDGRAQPLGDIALAYETMAGEARDSGIALLDHVRHLVVHGVLHLLGYDHETDADAARMEALETRVLAGMGVADPYVS